MQAIILAAGMGRRLFEASHGRPKCLLEVDGKTVLEHQLEALHGLGIESVCTVVGYRNALVEETVRGSRYRPRRPAFPINERYADTNSLYSLWLARDHVSGPFLVINGDVLAHPEAYRRVAAIDGTGLAFDSTSGHEDEHMKVAFDGARLQRISKDLAPDLVCGENLGILRISADAAPVVFATAEDMIASGGERDWAPAVLDRLADRLEIRGIDANGVPWTEIDTPEDLEHARSVWPAVRTPDPAPSSRPASRESKSQAS